jgi:hypothetical protein
LFKEKLMRKLKVSKIWIPAFLLAVALTGCSDPDKSAGAGNPGDPLTPPTVTAVSPPDGACITTPVTATFSKAMNPATINSPATTFTLAGPGGASVPGSVSLDSTGLVATFTPSNALVGGAAYMATVTTAAADTFGNHLAAPRTWTFMTGTQACAGAIAFGQPGCATGILAGSTVTNASEPTRISGDVDVWPGTAIVGLPQADITGGFFTGPGPGRAKDAQDQLTIAHAAAAGAAGGVAIPADIGGKTYAPGVYTAPGTLAITGILTLTGPGTFIFQIPTAMTTAAGSPTVPASQVILTGGALAQNVFWETGTAEVTLGTYSTFAGTIMAHTSITLGKGAVLNGRALAQIGAVTLDGNTVNVPPCQ